MIETVIETKQRAMELRKKARSLTFKHFCHRPTWAAAAGYDFNIVDCMSVAAQLPMINGGFNALKGIGDIKCREALWILPLHLVVAAFAFTWPLTFWLYGLGTWADCKRCRWKYRNTTNPVVQANISRWIDEVDLDIKRGFIK